MCPRSRCGIALDVWMTPLDEEIFPKVKQPIFFINSEKFHWAGNISQIKKLDSAGIQRKMITIRWVEEEERPGGPSLFRPGGSGVYVHTTAAP